LEDKRKMGSCNFEITSQKIIFFTATAARAENLTIVVRIAGFWAEI
jgi:hypothetical protein